MKPVSRFLFLSGALCAFPLPATEYIVRMNNGVPQVCADGKPVRTEIFWGWMDAAGWVQYDCPRTAGTDWTRVSVLFTPEADTAACGAVRVRLHADDGAVELRGVRLEDAYSNAAVFTSPAPRTLRATPETGRRVPLADGVSFVKSRTYRFTFEARAAQKTVYSLEVFDRAGDGARKLGKAYEHFLNEVRLARDAGVDIVSYMVESIWPKDEADRLHQEQILREQTDLILKSNPRAKLVPRIRINAPDWFLDAHPGEEILTTDPKTGAPQPKMRFSGLRFASPASTFYREHACASLARTVEWFNRNYPDSYMGCHPTGQTTGEFYMPGTWREGDPGFSDAERKSFRAFLRAKYKTDDALRAAWGDASATLDSAAAPSSAERAALKTGTDALNPADGARARRLLDFNLWVQKEMADLVLALARAARRATAERKLVFVFYGYIFEFASAAGGAARAGHCDLRRILDSPDIDVICSPQSYDDRRPGGALQVMLPGESVEAAGKLYVYEDDTRTNIARDGKFGVPGVATPEETHALLLRNNAQSNLRNFGLWWMDLGREGWFNVPEYWRVFDLLRPMADDLLARPEPYRPEIALVVDEKSLLNRANARVLHPQVKAARRAVARSGIPSGQYLLDDVLNGRLPPSVRLVVMSAASSLTDAEAARLREALAGRTVLWTYDPGVYRVEQPDGTRLSSVWGAFDAARFETLTGFKLSVAGKDLAYAYTPAFDALGVARVEEEEAVKVNRELTPYTVAEDAGVRVLARYANGKPAFVSRGNALYVGLPKIDTDMVLAAAQRAGIRRLAGNGCNAFRNGRWILLHASRDGDVRVDAGDAARVEDFLTGETLADGGRLTLPMKKGETRILKTH